MRDLTLEDALGHDGFNYKYEKAVAINSINWGPEYRINIRGTGMLDCDLVESYVIAKQNGRKFPAILLYRNDLVNGAHRLEMHSRLSLKKIDAYILTGEYPEQVISRLRRTVNQLQGQRLTFDRAIEQAMHLVNEGEDPKSAAIALAIPAHKVYSAMRVQKSTARFKELCPNLPLNQTDRVIINTITSDNDAREVAIRFVRSNLSPIDKKALVKMVRDAVSKSDTAREKIIKQYDITVSVQGSRRPPLAPLSSLLARIEGIVSSAKSGAVNALIPRDKKEQKYWVRKSIDSLLAYEKLLK